LNDTQLISGYALTRAWFDFAFENPRLVKPVHGVLYLWCVEKNNRTGWIREFQLPTDEGMQAIGVKDKETFLKAVKDLAAWGAIRIIQESVNIYVARFISLYDCKLSAAGCLDNVLSRPIKPDATQDALPAGIPDATTDAIPPATPDATPTNNKQQTSKPRTKKPKTDKQAPPLFAPVDNLLTGSETSIYNFAKKYFLELYLEQVKSGEYYFMAVDGKKLKSIITKVMFKVREKLKPREKFTEEEIHGAVKYFFHEAYVTGDKWLQANFTLTNLDTQFNSIYTKIIEDHAKRKIREQKNNGGRNAPATDQGVIDKINQRFK